MPRVRALNSVKYKGLWRIPNTPTAIFEIEDADFESLRRWVVEVEVPIVSDSRALPDDFPLRKKLLAAGITTLDELQALDDPTTLRGIGQASVEVIRRALNESF